MTKRLSWLALAAPLIFAGAACTRSLDTAACPCLDGWYCCPVEDVCAVQGTACKSEAVCGNGIIEMDETCDDGPSNGRAGHCTADCTSNGQCGNGVKDPGEQCDYCESSDAGTEGCWLGGASRTCNGDCTLARCGDGKVNYAAGEECDDALILDSVYCNGAPAPAGIACHFASCGDGYVNHAAGEECDDKNTASGDGCSSSCRVEAGYTCATPGSPCSLL
jgi:cysteine-rich repeat protein